MRDIGVALVELPAAELEAMDLPEKLYDAVMACRKITSHGAKLRQEMYIAKVMRGVDVEPIRETLERATKWIASACAGNTCSNNGASGCWPTSPRRWTELADTSTPPPCSSCVRSPGRRGPNRPLRGRLRPHASCSAPAGGARKAADLAFSAADCTMAR